MHGKLRHSQSRGSVERANQDIRNMVVASMQTTQTTDWAAKLWDIQFCKNRALHAGINHSPYEAMFGTKAKIGLSSSNLPIEVICQLDTEEDLEAAFMQLEGSNNSIISSVLAIVNYFSQSTVIISLDFVEFIRRSI